MQTTLMKCLCIERILNGGFEKWKKKEVVKEGDADTALD